jgi:hypothetical protein
MAFLAICLATSVGLAKLSRTLWFGAAAEESAARAGFIVQVDRVGWFGNEAILFNITGHKDEARRVDAIHALIGAAEVLKDEDFETMYLAHKGEVRFHLGGNYVRTTGRTRARQNVIYTITKFPQQLMKPSGGPAYSRVTGGFLGVLQAETSQLNSALDHWLGTSAG